MNDRAFGVAAVAAWLALAVSAVASPASAPDGVRPLAAFPRERIAVETRSARRHLFEAWRADTAQTRAQGLMFVPHLGDDQAMVFVYTPAQQVGMWMMNTLIPLDMLFVDEGGCIVRVHERAEPGSTETIGSGAPVALVVELAGGTAAALGIAAGDRVLRLDAQWPRTPRPCTGKR